MWLCSILQTVPALFVSAVYRDQYGYELTCSALEPNVHFLATLLSRDYPYSAMITNYGYPETIVRIWFQTATNGEQSQSSNQSTNESTNQ